MSNLVFTKNYILFRIKLKLFFFINNNVEGGGYFIYVLFLQRSVVNTINPNNVEIAGPLPSLLQDWL